MRSLPRFAGLLLLFPLALLAQPALSQELEPRAYRPVPSGLNFVVLAYSYSSGNVLVDATVPIEGLEAEIHTASLSYMRTFAIAGRSASVTLSAPYVHMSASATVDGQFLEGSRKDWADARARLAVILLGARAMSLSEFKRHPQGRALGVGLTVVMPTGQYDQSNLINFGANRWGFKPELGYSSVRGRWIFEAALGVWLFTTNHDGFGGTTVRQDPIGSLQGHFTYNFTRGPWLALNLNYFTGGQTSVDDQDRDDLQRNSRVGLTLSLPLRGPHSLKIAVHRGAFTRVGADFAVGTIAYQYRWGHESQSRDLCSGPAKMNAEK